MYNTKEILKEKAADKKNKLKRPKNGARYLGFCCCITP